MRRLIDWLYAIGNDKLLHFIAGIVVSQVAFAVTDMFFKIWWSAPIAFVSACIVGAMKELIDRKMGVPNVKDFAATAYGGILGTVLSIFIAI